ncbi:MAG: HAMP domain-containing sensor histidine kinase [Clostridia bacterium]|nr:HAMP domain-containing sensor histidine kinase [Clostridia bacterium]
MKRADRKSLRLAVMFSLVVTMLLISVVMMLLMRFGLLHFRSREIMLLNFALASVVIGTLFSQIFGKKAIFSIMAISEATKELTKGNFGVTLNENVRAAELGVMAHNFNLITQELAKSENFFNDFISNVSHEFKTPLAAIEGYATLLQSESLDEEKRAAYIEKILYNSKRLSTLAANILQLSRLENQEIVAEKERFALDEQIREVILLFEQAWAKKSLELDIDLDSAEYYGTRELIAQVWQNLLSNAIKFSDENGVIRLVLRRGTDVLRFTITDEGCGMSEGVAARVFEKFYQGESAHVTEGNGLGLTLARRIVELHGGEITLRTREGAGASFTVTLPIEKPETGRPARRMERALRKSGILNGG